MNAATKLASTILVAALLAFCSAGDCVGARDMARADTHPCCPSERAPTLAGCFDADCACVGTRPAQIPPGSAADAGRIAAAYTAQETAISQPVAGERAPLEDGALPAHDRYIHLHQLLI